MSWIMKASLVAALVAFTGCSSAQKDDQIRLQAAKISTLTSDNNQLVEQNRQLSGEREVLRARNDGALSQIEGLSREKQTYQQLVAAKESQIQREREIVRQAELRAEQAKRDNTHTVVNVSGTGGGGSGAAGSTGSAASSGKGGGKYHLRIISLPGNAQGEKTAQEMARFLSSQNIANATPRKSGNFWVIDVGHFDSIRSSDATSLKEKVRGMRYKGIEQFRSAYFAQY